MERRNWCNNGENVLGEIKKGPWKAEEDEVLMNHVNTYGPRNWSSIRSKGLLHRTGKSCRLRWVNKLRPNLKNGVKFSPEEERIVIDLQGQFGNKWARIATYLPGRTDNDVKNFWSSRKKRLARIAQNSTPQPNISQVDKISGSIVKEVAALPDNVPSLEAPELAYEDSLHKPQPCSSSSYIENFEAISMLDLMKPISFTCEPNMLHLEYDPCETKPFNGSQSYLPFLETPQVQADDFPLPLQDQDFTSRLGDLNFLDFLGNVGAPEPVSFLDLFGNAGAPDPVRSYSGVVKQEMDTMINSISPDSFIGDFPVDMFDPIEPQPSPSDWG